MLSLTRRIGERLVVSKNIWIKIQAIKGHQVVLHIDAPLDMPVHREEIHDLIEREGCNKPAQKWGKVMRLSEMLLNSYQFDTMDGALHYISEDGKIEGAVTVTARDKLTLITNLSRLLEVVSKAD